MTAAAGHYVAPGEAWVADMHSRHARRLLAHPRHLPAAPCSSLQLPAVHCSSTPAPTAANVTRSEALHEDDRSAYRKYALLKNDPIYIIKYFLVFS